VKKRTAKPKKAKPKRDQAWFERKVAAAGGTAGTARAGTAQGSRYTPQLQKRLEELFANQSQR
jgi:hypothetical protein